ncbi:MAG TPA: YetF domain-containing protein [Puia sp.]
MNIIDTLFGHGRDLNSLQMVCRSVGAFFLTLGMLRIAGLRTFGKKTPFDNVIIIMLGSIFSRVVVGASPFIPTTLGCLAFVLVHSFLGWLGFYNDRIGRWIKGEKSLLYSQGRERVEEMKVCQISEKDLLEAVRRELHQTGLEDVEEIYIERSGEISVIRKRPPVSQHGESPSEGRR